MREDAPEKVAPSVGRVRRMISDIEDRLAKEASELLRGRSSSVGDDDDDQRPENGSPEGVLEEWDESSVYGRLYGDAMKRLHARIEGSSTAPPDSSHDAGRRSFTEHMADSIMRL
ncbi:hypothetical protein FOZ60_002851 [Perkinsus olseni]|uniref:Uncharacterized protein n=1 Tax=Perkinsus olseni TaxID=32597 RepID=A0A7J6NWX0_PEROL|nr:hypothetical protein FOZ60_002851 [Perkinsus olseni]